ncbi:f-box protein [Quercus suber]|uniref:F-box protein n=1 Tax=Quercus suber TaxID=58331 RepID=A0AAW0JU18_QUESU
MFLGNHFCGIPRNFDSIMVSKGFLALINFGEGEAIVGSEICCIWVMEYGCIESWTKQFVLPLHQVSQFFGFVNNDEIPIDRFGRLIVIHVTIPSSSAWDIIRLEHPHVQRKEFCTAVYNSDRTLTEISRFQIPCYFALHCIARSQGHKFIMYFDVNDERFREILLPQNYLDGLSPYSQHLAVFKGLLALIVLEEKSNICHIWMMKEYGVAESWIKKSVPMKEVVRFLGFTVNGELLIQKFNPFRTLSFHPESLNEKILEIPEVEIDVNVDVEWAGGHPSSNCKNLLSHILQVKINHCFKEAN